MGLSKSRNMARANDIRSPEDSSASEDNSDSESDLANILQYLIRSGQVRILGRDTPHIAGYPKPKITGTSFMDHFDKSEVSHLTKKACGVLRHGPRPASKSVTQMLLNRESGNLNNNIGFSRPEKCAIENTKLPLRMRIIDSYENKAFSGIFSQDGSTLLTASQDRYLRTYDTTDGLNYKELQMIQGRDIGWSILDTAFNPQASKIAYSSWSTCLHLADIEGSDTGRHAALPLYPTERRFCVFALVFSESGDEILCSANDGHLYIYDLFSDSRTLRVDAHDDDVNTVAFADSTSQTIYSGGDDGFIKVWDRRTLSEESPKPVGILAGHLDGVAFIDSRGDGRHLISNSKDQSIKLWDIRVMSSKAAQENTKRAVSSNKWDYRWQTAPRKLITRKTNIKGDTSVATYRGHSVLQTLIRCRFSPAFSTGQRYIITGCAFGRVIVYDILTGKIALKLQGHSSCVRDISWHPYKTEIISTSWDFSVLCWTHFGLALESLSSPPAGINTEVTLGETASSQEEWDPELFMSQPLRRSRRIADRTRNRDGLRSTVNIVVHY